MQAIIAQLELRVLPRERRRDAGIEDQHLGDLGLPREEDEEVDAEPRERDELAGRPPKPAAVDQGQGSPRHLGQVPGREPLGHTHDPQARRVVRVGEVREGAHGIDRLPLLGRELHLHDPAGSGGLDRLLAAVEETSDERAGMGRAAGVADPLQDRVDQLRRLRHAPKKQW